MIKRRIGLVVLLVVVMTLTGCFGFLKRTEKELDHICVSFPDDVEVIEKGTSVELNVVGRAEDESTVIFEPETVEWTFLPEGAGTLTPDTEAATKAVFTAATDFTGEVTVKVVADELDAEITFEVVEVFIFGSKAWRDGMEEEALGLQGPGDEEQNYKNVEQDSDKKGVQMIDGTRGYADGTAFSHWNWRGHWIKWNLNVTEPGDYALVIRYATKEDSEYTKRTLEINDVVIRGKDDPIELPSTGGFAGDGAVEQWGYQVVEGITIAEAGEISLVLTHAGTAGARKGTNLAWIALVSPASIRVDEDFLVRIEEVIGVERTDAWD